VKRPEQHETDSEADAIFCAAFAKWAVTPSERDYGWDYVVEFFKEHESTGVLFTGQLKGSRHTEYSADGSFISQVLEHSSADYLARQLQQPTFLFHADVNSKRLFWSAIQLDQKLLAAIEKGDTKSLTVRIPTSNLLPGGIQRFLTDLTQSRMVVISRVLLDTRSIDFVDAMARQPVKKVSEVAEDLHVKGFRLELQLAHERRQQGDWEGAVSAVKKVLANSSSYLMIQFDGTLQLGELETYQLMKSTEPQSRVADKKLEIALKLCNLAKRQPRNLHLFAQIMRRAAELAVAVQKTSGLLMIWYGHKKRGDDPLWLAVLSFQLYESLLVAYRKYRQALRLAQATAKSQFRSVTSRPVAEIAISIGTLATLLDSCDLKEIALPYHKSAFEIIQFSAAIATENRSMDQLYHAVMDARILERDKDGEIFKWVRSVIDQWAEDSPYRKNAEELMQRAIARLEGAEFEGDIQTTPRQILHNILTSHDIDPTTEPWVRLIDLAITDDDPTRVLIECRHKNVARHPFRDPMLDRLGLERANPKIVVCQLHRYALSGLELDDINRDFKGKFCHACPDRDPRSADWTFYDEPWPQ
jgi:hypothetical protein